MKSYIVVVSIMIIINTGLANGQQGVKNSSMIGFKISKNYTTWITNQYKEQSKFDTNFDYSLDIFAYHRISNRFYFGYEFVISFKSFYITYPYISPYSQQVLEGTAKEAMIYFQLPLLASYIITEDQNKSLRLHAGPGIGFQKRFVLSGSSPFRGPVFDIILGLAFQLNPLVVEFRYDYSITDAYDIKLERNITGKLSIFSIMVGLTF